MIIIVKSYYFSLDNFSMIPHFGKLLQLPVNSGPVKFSINRCKSTACRELFKKIITLLSIHHPKILPFYHACTQIIRQNIVQLKYMVQHLIQLLFHIIKKRFILRKEMRVLFYVRVARQGGGVLHKRK